MRLTLRFKKILRWYKAVSYYTMIHYGHMMRMTEKKTLSDRLDVFLVDVPIKNNFSDALINNLQYGIDRIYSLEKRIAVLEGELDNKDLIIREQMNVIVNLPNSLKNVIFDGI